MIRFPQLAICLCASVFSAAGSAQALNADSSEAFPESVPPVAFVYVQSGTSHVYGYTAAANGQLHAVPGSPYSVPNTGTLIVQSR